MSTAFYPLGMKTYNNHVNQGGYKSWKGTGINSNPVGITAGTIRPLTNNDPTNNYPTGFGLPRPIKHARKGRSFNVLTYDPNTNQYIETNRSVKSSNGGTMVKQMMDNPGSFSVSENVPTEVDNITKLDNDCNNCTGIGIVASYYPNVSYLTENPEPESQTPKFCCNEERKARRRALPASTKLNKNYYTTLQQYRENRCQTYEQRAFNFVKNNDFIPGAKPGSALALSNTYVANCQPNILNYQEAYDNSFNPLNNFSACKLVVYKPNNPQYAQQGAVSSSTRLLKLNVTTIETNAASFKKNAQGVKITTSNITSSSQPGMPFILKNKVPKLCNPPINPFQNKNVC
jgi:hypothetical protein